MNKSRPRTGFRPKSTPSLGPINNNLYKSNPNCNKTFFIQEKEKGEPYFRSTRVGSCRRVVVKKWISLRFNIQNKKPSRRTNESL